MSKLPISELLRRRHEGRGSGHTNTPESFTKYFEQGEGCWLWLGSLTDKGYGRFYMGGKRYLAHRYSYEHFVGPIPEGLEPDHLCRVPACVNPAHLEPVTRSENTRRGWAARRSTTHG